ncbi:Glycosyl transferase family 41 [Phytophthora infestans]|uniref:protein O-GlcNAc transferase n=1 Tax=Phytophthora infestans TaxID=4787 RepID=A0A833S709_PHYIN|nr:Glycosyl transferase family 41 [Phytophthora infestans]
MQIKEATVSSNFRKMASSLWVLCSCVCVAIVAALSPGFNDPMPYYTLPLLEILHPLNDMMVAGTQLQVEIEVRSELLSSGLRRSRVCIVMQPAYVPPDVVLDNGAGDIDETCFDQSLNYTTFHVAGLIPGLSYALTVGLENEGNMVALSTRTFSVGSILLPGVDDRLSVADALEAGAELHKAQDRETASGIYRYVLAIFPNHGPAQHLLGLALYQDGELQKALPLLNQAVQSNESEENFHNSLGICLKSLGRVDEAIKHYRRAIELNPMQVQAAVNLGDAMQAKGKWEEAFKQYSKVASTPMSQLYSQLEPTKAENVAKDATGRLCELIRVTDGWYHADRCLNEALERWPDEPVFHNDRGNLLANAGQFETARNEYQRSSELGLLAGTLNLAETLEALGEPQKSIDLYNQVLGDEIFDRFHPRTRIMVMKATVLPRVLPATQKEIDAWRDRFELEVEALLHNLDSLEMTEVDPNRVSLSTAITLTAHNRNNRELKAAMGQLYWQLLYQRQLIREDYVASYGIIPLPYTQQMKDIERPEIGPRRLRVAFVSRYIFNSAVGLYMSELIPKFNRDKYEIIVFAIGQSKSMKVVKEVEAITDTIVALPKDVRMAREEIRAWKTDVLIYPELGMDKTTYFVSLARLAPVQAVWWGNADTSGVPTMDFYLTSEHEHSTASSHYSEAIYQLKGMGIYHKLPALSKKSINRDQVRKAIEERFDISSDFHFYLAIESIIHIHPDFDAAVVKLFEKDQTARLFLLSTSSRKTWKSQLQARMEAAGVDPGRLHFLTDVDQKQETMLMRAADAVIASLHLTRPRASLQAFAAGVPVVTFPNELWASRITYGFYRQMGINDLIATSLDDYVALAVKLATDTAFHKRMAQLIKRNRSKLSENEEAVREWEKFFDFAADQVFPSGELEPFIPTVESDWGSPEQFKEFQIDWSEVKGLEEWDQARERDSRAVNEEYE